MIKNISVWSSGKHGDFTLQATVKKLKLNDGDLETQNIELILKFFCTEMKDEIVGTYQKEKDVKDTL